MLAAIGSRLSAVGFLLLAVLVFRRADFGEVVSIRTGRRYRFAKP